MQSISLEKDREKMTKIYNQNKTNDFIADCTIRGILQLIGLQYGIWLKYNT